MKIKKEDIKVKIPIISVDSEEIKILGIFKIKRKNKKFRKDLTQNGK